jgi:hypothetical protein
MSTTTAKLTPDHASVKSTGMVVRDPTGRIGVIIGTRYAGDARVCHVLFRTGNPSTQWHPGVDLIPASDSAAKAAGYTTTSKMRGKAVRYDW